MLRSMFGMGGTEILVILVVALLFLGPDKLPEAAKKISQGIRDIKKQSRVLQRTIEDDEHIGGAIRDLKSALRGDDAPIRPPKVRAIEAAVATVSLPSPDETPALTAGTAHEHAADDAVAAHLAAGAPETYDVAIASTAPAEVIATTLNPHETPTLRMSHTAGEADDDAPRSTAADDADLAQLVKPAPNTIARSSPSAAKPVPAAGSEPSEPEHG